MTEKSLDASFPFRFQRLYIKDFHVWFNVFYIIKAMSIRELTWQIKQVVLEAQNFTSINKY